MRVKERIIYFFAWYLFDAALARTRYGKFATLDEMRDLVLFANLVCAKFTRRLILEAIARQMLALGSLLILEAATARTIHQRVLTLVHVNLNHKEGVFFFF